MKEKQTLIGRDIEETLRQLAEQDHRDRGAIPVEVLDDADTIPYYLAEIRFRGSFCNEQAA